MPDPSPNLIRAAIVSAVASRGLTHAELAERARVSRWKVSRYLSGHNDVNSATASRLCEVLGLEVKGADNAGVR